jgi:hypothetical protein
MAWLVDDHIPAAEGSESVSRIMGAAAEPAVETTDSAAKTGDRRQTRYELVYVRSLTAKRRCAHE